MVKIWISPAYVGRDRRKIANPAFYESLKEWNKIKKDSEFWKEVERAQMLDNLECK